MTTVHFNYVHDVTRGRYRLVDPIVYYSPRFKKKITCPEGMESDGASGPATDIVSVGWWVHDWLETTHAWDDGTPCSAFESSLVLYDILLSEGRWIRARTWFLATYIYATIRREITNMKIMSIWLMMVLGLIFMVSQTGCTAMRVIERDRQIVKARDVIEIKTGWEDGWEAKVGVDVLKVSQMKTGFLAALTEEPGSTLGAIAVDAAIGGGLYYLYSEAKDSNTEPLPPVPTYNIQADNVIIGQGNAQTWGGE